MIKLIKLIIAVMVLGTVGLTYEAKGAEFTLRFAGNLPVTHHVTKGQEFFAKLIEERTGGRVKVPVFPAGQLFADKDMMKAIPSGAVEMAEVTLSQWTGLAPGLLLLDLPMYFNDRQHIWRTVDGEVGEIFKKDLERAGVKLLYWMDYGEVELALKIPIRKLEDFKGQRIRVFGELLAESIRALGAAPAFLGAGEMYMALQRGTVDGVLSGPTSFYERKLFEVTKYQTDGDFGFAMFGVLINLNKWNELPPDIQKIILASSREAQEWGRKEAEKMDNESVKLAEQKGMEIISYSVTEKERLRKACFDTVKAAFLKRAADGQRLLDLAEKVR
jgi:tripartite ATP-independent transporter DctP family solute receptor